MSQFDSEESSFEPALLLALTIMVGVALGRDVFYDVVTQAVAMTALALLVAALVFPVLGLARMLGSRRPEPGQELYETPETEHALALQAPPAIEQEPVRPEPTPPQSLERNAGSSGVRVRAATASHNDNQGWSGSRLSHSGLR